MTSARKAPGRGDEDIPVLKNSNIYIPEKTFVIENDVMNVGADETQRTLTWYSPVSETISVQLAPFPSSKTD